jgi:hypothetical protein
MNKNLGYYDGEPNQDTIQNAHFWRWLLARITDQPEWIPPPMPDANDTQDTDQGPEGQPSEKATGGSPALEAPDELFPGVPGGEEAP